MRRRLFNKVLALGAGAFPLAQVAAAEKPDPESSQAAPPTPGGNPADRPEPFSLPVNIAGFADLARAKLPKATFDYITTGSADEITLRDNVEAFRRIKVVPPLLTGVAKPDLSTTVLGQKISMPVMLAPVAALRLYHPQGGMACVRAAASAGTLTGVSTSVGNSAEEIASAARGPLWFQLYVPRDRRVARRLVERVERAGYKAIIVTVDLGEWKDQDRRNQFSLPKKMLLKHLRDVGHEQLSDRMSYQELLDFNATAWDLTFSWDFFQWLRGVTRLPILIKGVLSKKDALKAVQLGLDGIVVSNHGGRRLDTMPASIDVLEEIATAVGDRAEVFMDSGVRRGTDVLKALALGARAVLIGRPYAWALAADGQQGVARALEIFRAEFHNAMVTAGCAKVSDVDRSLLL